SLAEEMTERYGVAFSVLPNCEPRAAGASQQVSPDKNEGPVRFLYQGNFAPGRGLEELIRAWTLIDPSTAVLHLRGPNHPNRDACIALAKSLGVYGTSVEFP